jgi:hypothetical protein
LKGKVQYFNIKISLGTNNVWDQHPYAEVSFIEKDTTGWLRVVNSGQITLGRSLKKGYRLGRVFDLRKFRYFYFLHYSKIGKLRVENSGQTTLR